MTAESDSPLTFPCYLPVKVFGRNATEFRHAALAIIQSHFAEISAEQVSERESKGGNYLSLTVTVHARSRAQIDAFYEDLSAHDSIMMAL